MLSDPQVPVLGTRRRCVRVRRVAVPALCLLPLRSLLSRMLRQASIQGQFSSKRRLTCPLSSKRDSQVSSAQNEVHCQAQNEAPRSVQLNTRLSGQFSATRRAGLIKGSGYSRQGRIWGHRVKDPPPRFTKRQGVFTLMTTSTFF